MPPKGWRRYDPADIAEGIRKANGLVTIAARGMRMSPETVNRYIAEYPECAAALDEAQEFRLDVAESQLLAAVGRGEPWAISMYLKTKGRSRGYSEHFDIRSWLLERAAALAEERGLDKEVVMAQAERLLLGGGRGE